MDQINPNYLFICVLTIAGTLVLVSGLVTMLSAIRSRSWPCVAGVVTISKTVSVKSAARSRTSEPSWAPEVHYQYTVTKTKFTGTLICFGMEGLSGGREFAATYKDRYPVGKVVQVFYEPNRAENCVLEPGISIKFFWPVAVGVALLVLSVSLVLHEWSRIAG